MAKQGEKVIENYLKNIGLFPKKIKESDTKSPDFEVHNDEKLLFYCEEKTLEYDDFIGEKNDSSRNAISTHIKKAQKQFEQINPNHKYPNILVFNNYDTLKNANDLFITITGYGVTEEEKLLKLYSNIGRIEEKINIIDLYIWFDNDRYSNHIWSDFNDNHKKELKLYFG